MKREIKIYQQALASPSNVEFNDLCYLIDKIGFELRPRTGSSHLIYNNSKIHDRNDSMLNMQESKDGKAKPYQVRQVLNIIERYGLMDEITDGGGL